MECHYEWYDATYDYYAYLNAHYYAYLHAHDYKKKNSFSNNFGNHFYQKNIHKRDFKNF